MITLQTIGHDFHYEMENLCRVFFPNEKISVVSDEIAAAQPCVVTELIADKDNYEVFVSVDINGQRENSEATVPNTDEPVRDECERAMARELFKVLCNITGYTPPWGILTGVRPSKLMTRLADKYGEKGAQEYFTKRLLVSPKKTALAQSVLSTQREMLSLGDAKSFSLYIAIPFCPSRCSYCSFVSHSITSANAAKLLPVYVDKLCEEIGVIGAVAAQTGLRLESIYVGGGTPGILTPEQMTAICTAVDNSFDISAVREYTVEVGRPETVTQDKLDVLRRFGVGRISINPQTLNDRVLEAIGRKHTVEDFFKAYDMAKSSGFDNINVDLIAGLPGDDIGSFKQSVDGVADLDPANVTVHALALKSASSLAEHGHTVDKKTDAGAMIDYSQSVLMAHGYLPYYMYRQSRCVGNLENVGWSKPQKECLYNIFMMEETHTVLAAGSGAVTKLKKPGTDYIERIFNYKYPYEYNNGFDELMKRKNRIREFYEEV